MRIGVGILVAVGTVVAAVALGLACEDGGESNPADDAGAEADIADDGCGERLECAPSGVGFCCPIEGPTCECFRNGGWVSVDDPSACRRICDMGPPAETIIDSHGCPVLIGRGSCLDHFEGGTRDDGGGDADADDADADDDGDADFDDADVTEDVEDVEEISDGTDGETGHAGIYCGYGICEASTQVCCVRETPASQECVTPGTCGELSVTCDGPEDCGSSGDRCCLPSGAVMGTYCNSGACPSGDTACHDDSECGDGEACCANVLLGWTHESCRTAPCS